MPGKVIKPQVIEYFTKRPGETLYVTDLASALGVDKTQVQQCITNFKLKGEMPDLETLVRGNSWVYKPNHNKSNDKRLFEELGVTKSGAIVIQDSDGNLWRAEPIN